MLRSLIRFLKPGNRSRNHGKNVGLESRNVWSEYATPYRFRFEVLGNAVFEGSQSLQDVLDVADEVFGNDSTATRGAIAREALEKLLAENLVTLDIRSSAGEAPQDVRGRALAALTSRDPHECAQISIRATTAGIALAEDPPDEIRRLWRLPEGEGGPKAGLTEPSDPSRPSTREP